MFGGATTKRARAPVERLASVIVAWEYPGVWLSTDGFRVAKVLPTASDSAWLSHILAEHRLP